MEGFTAFLPRVPFPRGRISQQPLVKHGLEDPRVELSSGSADRQQERSP
jgi:hypothetical protein